MAQKNCEECKTLFEYQPPVGFPDKRKYCDACSAKKKAEWESKKQEKVPENAPKQAQTQISQHDVVIQRTDKPHSLEIGKAGQRHKIYYNDVAELKAHIELLKNAGLYEEMGMDVPVEKV